MKVQYYGHSCFSVETGGKVLLFDPFITPNPLAQGVDVNQVPADYILISHGHQDHVTDAPAIARRTGATIITNYEIAQWLSKSGLTKLVPLNHGGSHRAEYGRAKYVIAIHSSSLPDGTYGGNPGGFVVETGEGNFYFSGDTALTREMKTIGETTTLRFAALCIGDGFTMGIDDAVRAAEWIRCDTILGVHYDTFPPIKIDHEQARKRFQAAGKKLHLVPIGSSIEV